MLCVIFVLPLVALAMAVWLRNSPADDAIDNTPDDDLVVRAREGDNAAFNVLARRHRRWVSNKIRQNLVLFGCYANANSIEDATQEVFIRAYSKLGLIKPGVSFRNYIKGFVLRVSYETKGQMNRSRSAPFESTNSDGEQYELQTKGDEPSAEEKFLESEGAKAIYHAIYALPDEFRMVVYLCIVKEMRYDEVADILGIPINTVRTRLFRGRGKLQDNIRKNLRGDF